MNHKTTLIALLCLAMLWSLPIKSMAPTMRQAAQRTGRTLIGATETAMAPALRYKTPVIRRPFSTEVVPVVTQYTISQPLPGQGASSSEKAFLSGLVAGGMSLATATAFYNDWKDNREIYEPAFQKGVSFQKELLLKLNDPKLSTSKKDLIRTQLLISYITGKISTDTAGEIALPCQVNYQRAKELIEAVITPIGIWGTITTGVLGKSQPTITAEAYLDQVKNTNETEDDRMKRIKNEYIKQEKERIKQSIASRYK